MNIKNKLKMVKLSEIKPYSKNAKKHPKWQVDLITESLKNNDYYSPIGISESNEIVIGHGRYEAMLQLKGNDDLIEVVDFSYLGPSKIKKLRIMDNKIVSDEYDKELLEAELKEIANSEGVSITDILKDIGDTDGIIAEINDNQEINIDDIDDTCTLSIKLDPDNYDRVVSALREYDENMSNAIIKALIKWVYLVMNGI